MARTADVGLRATWEQRLQRLETWTGTVKQFCVKERVSMASLYQWRRKLDSNGSASRTQGQGGCQRTARNRPSSGPAFVPVQVVGSAVVEVYLAQGVRLLIPADATDALSTVVRALSAEMATAGEDSGGPSC